MHGSETASLGVRELGWLSSSGEPRACLLDRSASKNEAEKRLAPSKLAERTTLCWKATPFRFSPRQSELSRLTPRVIVIRRPCVVEKACVRF